MVKSGLVNKLRTGLYTGLTVALIGCGGGGGSPDTPVTPPVVPEPVGSSPNLEFSVSAISGYAPLEARITGNCTDPDGDLSSYKVFMNGTELTTENPTDLSKTLTENTSFSAECSDAKGHKVSKTIDVEVLQPELIGGIVWQNQDRSNPEKFIANIRSGDIVIENGEYKIINKKVLTPKDINNNWYPTFSADGKEIYFTSNGASGNFALFAMNAKDGSNRRDISSNLIRDATEPDSCSNGEIAVAYVGDNEAGIGVIDANNNLFTPVYSKFSEDGGAIRPPGSPSWNADCSDIAFHEYIGGNWEVMSIDRNGTVSLNLTNNPARDQVPDSAEDGIYFNSARDSPLDINSTDKDLYFRNKDGSVKRITDNDYIETSPAANANGKYLLITNGYDDSTTSQIELLKLNEDKSVESRTQLTSEGANMNPAWRPN